MEAHRYRGYQRCSRIDYSNPANVFFITLCVHPRRSIFITNECNTALVEVLKQTHNEGFWGIFLYCLMPDHLHLVANPGHTGLPAAVKTVKGRFSVWWRIHGDGKRLWQDGFFDHCLRSEESFEDKCQYVIVNPVRAGLVSEAKQYPWVGSWAHYTGRK